MNKNVLFSYGRELAEKGVRIFDEMSDINYKDLSQKAKIKLLTGKFDSVDRLSVMNNEYIVLLRLDTEPSKDQLNFDITGIVKL